MDEIERAFTLALCGGFLDFLLGIAVLYLLFLLAAPFLLRFGFWLENEAGPWIGKLYDRYLDWVFPPEKRIE